MTTDNFDQTLTALLDRTPFRPFTVVMSSGTRFEIDHPKAVVTRSGVGVAVFISPGGALIIFDHEGVEHFVADLAGQSP